MTEEAKATGFGGQACFGPDLKIDYLSFFDKKILIFPYFPLETEGPGRFVLRLGEGCAAPSARLLSGLSPSCWFHILRWRASSYTRRGCCRPSRASSPPARRSAR
jgi:hypothetical protein